MAAISELLILPYSTQQRETNYIPFYIPGHNRSYVQYMMVHRTVSVILQVMLTQFKQTALYPE